MKKLLLFLFSLPIYAQLISPSATVRMGAVPSSCVAGSSNAIVVNNAGTDEFLVCDNTGHYTLPPGGSTSVLTANGVGATGAAGSNKLVGPASSIITTDGSGNGSTLPTVSGDGTLNPSTGVLGVSKIAGQVPGTLFPLNIPAATPVLKSSGSGFIPSVADTDFQSAVLVNILLNGSGTTRIASAISNVGSAPSVLWVPPSYANTEALPGAYYSEFGSTGASIPFVTAGASTPSTIPYISDQRRGNWEVYNGTPITSFSGFNIALSKAANCNWYQSVSGVSFPEFLCNSQTASYYGVGGNYCNSFSAAVCNKTTFKTSSLVLNNWGQGQTLTQAALVACYGVGDCQTPGAQAQSFGGVTDNADEGVQEDLRFLQGNQETIGTITSGGTVGSTSLVLNISQGKGQQGGGRFVIDAQSPINTGTIASVTTSTTAPQAIVGSGTSWTASTAIGTIALPIPAAGPGIVVTPTFTTGSISNITTSTLVCVQDQIRLECVYPTQISGSTFTATFLYPHNAGAGFAVGGLTGYGFELVADEVTAATFPSTYSKIHGTLRRVYPIVSVTDSTHLLLWVAGKGTYIPLASSFDATTANTYNIFPMARIASVLNPSGFGVDANTLTLEPNNATWVNGDSVEVLLYPSVYVGGVTIISEHFFPNVQGSAGLIFTQHGLAANNDILMSLSGDTPHSFYTLNGGKYAPPAGIVLTPEVSWDMKFTYHGDTGGLQFGCPASAAGCSDAVTRPVIQMLNGGTADNLYYNHLSGQWQMTAGLNAGNWTWNGATFNITGAFRFGSAAQFQGDNGGNVKMPTLAGTGTATFAPQTGAGSGATAVCATSHVCDSVSGEVTLTSGTIPAIGSDLIITLPITRTNQPNCAVELKGGTIFLGDTKTVTTSTITISTGAALAAATAYTIDYVCGGN